MGNSFCCAHVNKDTELNGLLENDSQLEAGKLDTYIQDPKNEHKLMAPDTLQCVNRNRQDLSIYSRQKLILAAHKKAKQPCATCCVANDVASGHGALVRDLFLDLTGDDLIDLKHQIQQNEAGLGEDLHEIVFASEFPGKDEMKTRILDHLQNENACASFGTSIQVLSDIDDTLYPSLLDWGSPGYAGKLYPGVITFLTSLCIGPAETNKGGIIFITARPRELKKSTKRLLESKGIKSFTIVPGSIQTFLHNNSMAQKKFQNFQELVELWPECKFVWVGDSGQGDISFAKQMLLHYPDKIAAVLIHDVITKKGEVKTPPNERVELANNRILLFDDYPDAARLALKKGLLSASQVRTIQQEADEEVARRKIKKKCLS
eukprot:Platyproteum_vivax@DN12199_c0_g1_i1.p1